MAGKPQVLILGGVGMVGRNFIQHLLDTDACSFIRVADKTMPQIAFMHSSHEELFDNPIVEFVQTDLTKDAHLEKAFKPSTAKGSGSPFEYVINLAAETRYGQVSSVYESRCTELSRLCALKAANSGCVRYIEMSTALIYKSQARVPSSEDASKDPWTTQSQAKYMGEKAVSDIGNNPSTPLNYVILRPSTIYGPGDTNGLMPRCIIAGVYQELKETMKFLWDAKVKLNTVHVTDVCRAIWHVVHSHREAIPSGSIFNVSDEGDTDIGMINDVLCDIFGIDAGFHGIMLSNVARLRMNDVVDTANDKHLEPWEAMCRRHTIDRTPLSPFMCKELLEHQHLYVDGSAITGRPSSEAKDIKSSSSSSWLGGKKKSKKNSESSAAAEAKATRDDEDTPHFVYTVPRIDKEKVKESILMAIQSGTFPPII